MAKYQTGHGTPCTEEECKLIDSIKRLAKRWENTPHNRLWIFCAAGDLKIMMGEDETNPVPELCETGGTNPENFVTDINGIRSDGGDW